MAALRPPVPPRPHSSQANPHDVGPPPPIPPLPPNFRPELEADNDARYFASGYDSSSTPGFYPPPPQIALDAGSAPHYADPLVAPRPQRLTPDVPADMARTLDEQIYTNQQTHPPPHFQRLTTPQPPHPQQQQGGYNPGGFMFRAPSTGPGMQQQQQQQQQQQYRGGPAPAPPPPPGAGWASPPLPTPQMPGMEGGAFPGRTSSLTATMAGMSLGPGANGSVVAQAPRVQSMYATVNTTEPLPLPGGGSPPRQRYSPPAGASASSSNGQPSLTAPLPTVASLQAALPAVQNPSADPQSKVAWCRDVLQLVNRVTVASNPSPNASASATSGTGTDLPMGPARIADPTLARLADVAVPLIMQLSSSPSTSGTKLPPYASEALYLRASLSASGAFPTHLPPNPRVAFREFEAAARAGHHAAWFRLGRDYETFGDEAHARECFERGVRHNVESCVYRMGMAHLMGQLGLPASPAQAVPLLQKAATLATVAVPQPAYVYALLLLNDFNHISIPAALFAPLLPPGATPESEARKHLERAAYLNFAPAQYKLGHAYEFATPPYPFDALLSVQYYSLASQQGESEADMALSKWFLCGAEGSFEKDEGLAYTFAEKAARKGLPSAEFAMGYYFEVGIGTRKDVEKARGWYEKAAAHGNADASDRLKALSQSSPQALSRQQHESLADTTLVRKRTQAKQRSDAVVGLPNGPGRRQGQDATQVVEVIRRNSLMYQQQAQRPEGGPGGLGGGPPPSAFNPPRKSSFGTVQGLPPGPGPQQQLQRPPGAGGAGLPFPQQQQQQQQQQMLPPPGNQIQNQNQNQNPNTAAQRFQDRHRYTLSDAGPIEGAVPVSGGGGGRTQSPSRPGGGGVGRGGGRIVSGGTGVGAGSGTGSPKYGSPRMGDAPLPNATQAGQGQSQGGVKYNTFEEMGFQSKKLDDKECVVM